MVNTAAPLAVLATGATIVVLCGGIDLSIAALASLSSVFLALWLPSLGGLSTLAVVGVAAAVGALQGALHVVLRIPSFIVTLGGMSVFAAIALVVSVGRHRAGHRRRGRSAGRTCTSRAACRPPSSWRSSWWRCWRSLIKVTPLDSYIKATGFSEAAARLARRAGRRRQDRGVLRLGRLRRARGGAAGRPQLQRQPHRGRLAAAARGRGHRRRRHRDHRAATAACGGRSRGPWWSRCSASGSRPSASSSAYEQILYGAIIIVAVALTLDRSKVLVIK